MAEARRSKITVRGDQYNQYIPLLITMTRDRVYIFSTATSVTVSLERV